MDKVTLFECYLCRTCKTIARLMAYDGIDIDDHNTLVAIALTLSIGKAVPADYAALEYINGKYPIDDFLQ